MDDACCEHQAINSSVGESVACPHVRFVMGRVGKLPADETGHILGDFGPIPRIPGTSDALFVFTPPAAASRVEVPALVRQPEPPAGGTR
jgi:hypothetical protein